MGLLGNVLINVVKKSAAGIALCFIITVAAADETHPTWSFRGFGSLGILGSDQPGFRRDITQTPAVARDHLGIGTDSRLGLQLDLDINQPFHVTVQWIARDRAGDFLEQNLERAFLRWRPRTDLDVRLGRIGNSEFMLSDYRNVGYAYPWMRPPHEFYRFLIPYHIDGGDLTWKRPFGDGYLALKSFAGYNLTQIQPANTVIDREYLLAGASLSYESGEWRARLGYTWAQHLNDTPQQAPLYALLRNPTLHRAWPGAAALADDLSLRDKVLNYVSLGLAYDNGTWLAETELAYITSDILGFRDLGNGYLSLGRRIGSFTPYTLLGGNFTFANPSHHIPQLAQPSPALTALRNGIVGLTNTVEESSVSLGLRWDVYQNTAIKAQWSHFWLNSRAALPSAAIPDTANVWSLGVDFVF